MVGGVFGFVGVVLGGDCFVVYVFMVVVVIVCCWCLNVGSVVWFGGVIVMIVLLFLGNGLLWDVLLIWFGEVMFGMVCVLGVCWVMLRIEWCWFCCMVVK